MMQYHNLGRLFYCMTLTRHIEPEHNMVLAKKGRTEVIELSEFYCNFVLRLG